MAEDFDICSSGNVLAELGEQQRRLTTGEAPQCRAAAPARGAKLLSIKVCPCCEKPAKPSKKHCDEHNQDTLCKKVDLGNLASTLDFRIRRGRILFECLPPCRLGAWGRSPHSQGNQGHNTCTHRRWTTSVVKPPSTASPIIRRRSIKSSSLGNNSLASAWATDVVFHQSSLHVLC